MADVAMAEAGEFELPARKKPKVAELPLSSTQRASIDSMLHTFKKKGEFDALRKKTYQQYSESAQRGIFEQSLRAFTGHEIDCDAVKYLRPDRRMGVPLLEGAAARSDVYKKTEADIDAYIDQYLGTAERALREIRRKDIGDETADEEVRRGEIGEDVYAEQAEERKRERAVKRKEEEALRKKQELQERKKKEKEELMKKHEALMKETERLQREKKRREEREAWKAAEKEKERERIRKYNEEREKAKQEAEERARAAAEEKEKRQREKAEREQKRIEEEALQLLLREGQRMAEKAKRPELERSESMEPPPRLHRYSTAARNQLSKEEMRSQGLMPTSLTLRRGDKSGPPIAEHLPASAAEDDRRRPYRARSPSPARSGYGRNRREASREREVDRRSSYRERDATHRRDNSVERAAWKNGRARERSRGEEGEVVERTSIRARSRSRESFRRHRDSRSPPRRRYRESRSRSPPRYRDRERERDRDRSRRRDRSRSPLGIDRYVPGGGSSAPSQSSRRARDFSPPRRSNRPDSRDRRRTRYDDEDGPSLYARQSDVDRYVPGSGRADEERPRRRSRSRERARGARLDPRDQRGGETGERERTREREVERRESGRTVDRRAEDERREVVAKEDSREDRKEEGEAVDGDE
nr:hypothetical protein CFP56_02837 [Quercus suber]